MPGYMSGIPERGGNLLTRELVIRPKILGRGTRSKFREHHRDIDASAGDAGFSEPNFRIHRNAGKNFHTSHPRKNYHI